jgi:hypothetical protein
MRLRSPWSGVAADQLYEVAYDEAVRALSEQQGVIESLRGRAGLLFSAAAVTTSFLGAQALRGGDLNFASWLALLCFVAVAVASLAALWPRRWELTANPRDLIEGYIESPAAVPIEVLHRDLALYMHHGYLDNRRGLNQLAAWLQIASGLLALEVVLWIVAIALTF